MMSSIRNKLLLIIGSVLLLILSFHAYLQLSLQGAAFELELQKRTSLLKDNLNQRALAQIFALESLAAEDIASYNLFSLTNKIQDTVQETKELISAIVLDNDNKIYIHTAKPELQQTTYIERQKNRHDTTVNSLTTKTYTISFIHESFRPHKEHINMQGGEETNPSLTEYQVPINIGDSTWGSIILVYSLAALNDKIAQSQDEHQTSQHELAIKTLYLTFGILFVACTLISQLSKRLISPIIKLSAFAKDLAEGDFSRIHKISTSSNDEVGKLTQNFAYMALKLEDSYQQQAQYSQTLENKVNKRTEALHHKNEELVQALNSLEESQQQLIQSEKMAALGQLIAGIAHEINTPLGAIQASVGNSSKSLVSFNRLLPEYLASSSSFEHELLCELLTLHEHLEVMSTREERKIKRELNVLLNKHNIEKADELAEMFVDMGLGKHTPELLAKLARPSSFEVIKLAHHLTGIGRNSETIRIAIGRASKVVFALKNFAHLDNTGQEIMGNINHGIQTVLILYQGLIKQGCELVEHFGELPDILCFPDELNQVWTNLIHNALHAMQNKGTLTITTVLQTTTTNGIKNQHIVVTVSDTGSGIPLEVQPKIYDSFFTTKLAGEGSGLGLGICKRILDKHEGSISFTSEPGKTSFMVYLPVSSPSMQAPVIKS